MVKLSATRALQTRTVRAYDHAGNDTALSVAPVLRHALYLAEPDRIADDRRAHGIPHGEVRKVLLDVRRNDASAAPSLSQLLRARDADILGEPEGLAADRSTLVQVEQHLRYTAQRAAEQAHAWPWAIIMCSAWESSSYSTSFGAVTARQAAESFPALVE